MNEKRGWDPRTRAIILASLGITIPPHAHYSWWRPPVSRVGTIWFRLVQLSTCERGGCPPMGHAIKGWVPAVIGYRTRDRTPAVRP